MSQIASSTGKRSEKPTGIYFPKSKKRITGIRTLNETTETLAKDQPILPNKPPPILAPQQEEFDEITEKLKSGEITLTEEQRHIIEFILGHPKTCVFLTGPGGTGKSVIIREICSKLSKVVLGAPTGIASENIGGHTLHSLFSLQKPNLFGFNFQKHVDALIKDASLYPESALKYNMLKSCETLIIDEISMVSKVTLTWVERVLALIKDAPDKPFGGVRVICVGDFLQLAPVWTENLETLFKENMRSNSKKQIMQHNELEYPHYEKNGKGFVFELFLWKKCFAKSFVLQKVMRQNDEIHSTLLNQIRLGFISDHYVPLLLERILPIPEYSESEQKVVPPYLCATKEESKQINENRLGKINKPQINFKATYSDMDEETFKAKLRDTTIPKKLCLKIGAQVACTKNLKITRITPLGPEILKLYNNGSKGIVVGFTKSDETKDQNSEQDPESDGTNKTGVVVVFEGIVGEVTISVVSWEFLSAEFSKDGQKRVIQKKSTISQIPLKLNWADTIHSNQGISVDEICINLSQVFEQGQSYVALSRVRTLEGLTLVGFDKSAITANPKALEFTRNLCKKTGAYAELFRQYDEHLSLKRTTERNTLVVEDIFDPRFRLVSGQSVLFSNVNRLTIRDSNRVIRNCYPMMISEEEALEKKRVECFTRKQVETFKKFKGLSITFVSPQ